LDLKIMGKFRTNQTAREKLNIVPSFLSQSNTTFVSRKQSEKVVPQPQ
jgi:hypothetical protein